MYFFSCDTGKDTTEPSVASARLASLEYVKYKSELYGLLCGVTLDDAKGILKEMVDSGGEHDGFKALLILSRRFDSSTAAGLLRSYLTVVTPKKISGSSDLVSAVHGWEANVAILKERYGEVLGDKLKLAILVGMLPNEFRDLVLQSGAAQGTWVS